LRDSNEKRQRLQRVNLLDNQRSNQLYYQTSEKGAVLLVKISEIEGDLAVKGELEGSCFRDVEESGFSFAGPVTYDLTVKKIGDVVGIKGPIKCALTLTCSKCLEEFIFPVNAFLDIELVPAALIPSASEFELKGDDLDVEYYEGDEIELEPFVFEEIMLSIPIKPVCREECNGLCEGCGVNRNYEQCRCSETAHTILGEKLKSFLN
jgi:uncharacterized protein